MDLHDLLLDLVADGISGEYRVHTIECAHGHVCGYAKVPLQTKPWPISVLCSVCKESAYIGAQIERKTKPIEAPAAHPAPAKEPAKKVPFKGATPALKAAWAAGEAKRVAEWDATAASIDKQLTAYLGHPPTHPLKALDALVRQTPYKKMPPNDLYQALWLAHDIWKDKFVSEAAAKLGCRESAMRSRVETTWDILPDILKLRMPFMTKACRAPSRLAVALDEAKAKHALVKPPAENTPVIVATEANTEKPPEENRGGEESKTAPVHPWRQLNKMSK